MKAKPMTATDVFGAANALPQFLTDIFYLVAVPDWRPEEATPLAGFTMDLCRSSELIRRIAYLPANIFELMPEHHIARLPLRICGTGPIELHPQSPRAIMSRPLPLFTPFTVVVLGPGQSAGDYAAWLETCPVRPVLVAETGGTMRYEEFTLEALQAAFLESCEALASIANTPAVQEAREAIVAWTPMQERTLPYVLGGHNTIRPNVAALAIAGFDSAVEGAFQGQGDGIVGYVDQIVKTSQSILDERAATPETIPEPGYPRRPALTLFAPAVFPEFTNAPAPHGMSREEQSRFKIARNLIVRQRGYAYDITTEAQAIAMSGMTTVEARTGTGTFEPHFLMQARKAELDLSTALMEILAASEFSAVARLPNDVNRTASAVRQFANHYRSNLRTPANTLDDFRAIQSRLVEAVPSDLMSLIERAGSDIRIVGNAPLEWLPLSGVPLCLRRNVSRIGATPGNLLVEQLGPKAIWRLLPADVGKVLVLSALHPRDVIRGMFETAFETFEKHWRDRLELIVVEVKTADDMVSALNAFDGAIAIFDGHGDHKVGKSAVLKLQDEDCDVWSLRPRIERAPPIMILSACDTHAADRNHATTANGFLAMGCRAVLGSVFPLGAKDAAIFSARLLYRIVEYVPAAINVRGRAHTWAEICTGMLQMQAATDFRYGLKRKRLLDDGRVRTLGEESNYAINIYGGDPFETILDKAIELGVAPNRARRELEIAIASSSAISYLQLGRPETILFDTPERQLAASKEEADVITDTGH